MMRRLRLNFYRAEDAFLIMKKKQWAEEDKEFEKQKKNRKKEDNMKRLMKNRQRRHQREFDQRSLSLPSLIAEENNVENDTRTSNFSALMSHFNCPVCDKEMLDEIYQCVDGHILCADCYDPTKVCKVFCSLNLNIFHMNIKVCHECNQKLSGRNYTMERLARIIRSNKAEAVFPVENQDHVVEQGQDNEDIVELSSISDTSV